MEMPNPNSQPQGFLEDLLTPINNTLTTFPSSNEDLFPTSFSEEDASFLASNSSLLQLISSSIQPTSFYPNLDTFTPLNVSNSSSYEQQTYDCDYGYGYGYEYEDKPRSVVGFPTNVAQQDEDKKQVVVSDNQISSVFSIGEKKSNSKKVVGQPSKNLMAERRRRKRLNDRLTMLRSIVPKISKMDRTSILGDTIEYMKDLMEKIRIVKAQDLQSDSNSFTKELKINVPQPRNPPKFEVDRTNIDTRIQICCSAKPGLLFSTVNTIEALGLDIQQCVISSFGDFTLQASCFEALENRVMMNSDEIKQILLRNAGYGGKGL